MKVKLANNAETTLAGSINESATTVLLAPGTGVNFPALGANEFFPLTLVKIVSGEAVREIVHVTARNVDSCTVLRAREGTTAVTFSAGDYAGLHVTRGAFDAKMDLDGGAFAGPVAMGDNDLSGAALKDSGQRVGAPMVAGGVATFDYRNGSYQPWAPAPGTYQIIITNWPPSGINGELWIPITLSGAVTLTTQVPLLYRRSSDGLETSTTSVNTNQGATLRTSGTEDLLIWGAAGAPAKAKIAR